MKPLFIQYAKCSTCRKAAAWLKTNGIEVETRDIVTQNPTPRELRLWIPRSCSDITKCFNSSGLRYKELHLKDVVKSASPDKLMELLASEGKLIKRPILVTEKIVLFGFNEAQWAETLLAN